MVLLFMSRKTGLWVCDKHKRYISVDTLNAEFVLRTVEYFYGLNNIYSMIGIRTNRITLFRFRYPNKSKGVFAIVKYRIWFMYKGL